MSTNNSRINQQLKEVYQQQIVDDSHTIYEYESIVVHKIRQPVRLPDKATRGRGGRPNAGPPRPMFRPNLTPSAPRGGRGKPEDQKEENKEGQKSSRRPQVKKEILKASPFGGPPAQPQIQKDDSTNIEQAPDSQDKQQSEQEQQIKEQSKSKDQNEERKESQEATGEVATGSTLYGLQNTRRPEAAMRGQVSQTAPKSQESKRIDPDDAKFEDRPMQISPQKKEQIQNKLNQESEQKKSQDIKNDTDPQKQQTQQTQPKSNQNITKQGSQETDKNQMEDRKGGFFNMITGYLGALNLRKQAYTGKPSSAMYYDEKKGRYIIMGEEESDDDEPPPPPPGMKRGAAQEQKSSQNEGNNSEQKKQTNPDDGKVQGLNALTAVGFGGALSRGRGKPRGRGGAQALRPRSNFPNTFNPAANGGKLETIQESSESKNQPDPATPQVDQSKDKDQSEQKQEDQIIKRSEINNALYQTALDQSVDQSKIKRKSEDKQDLSGSKKQDTATTNHQQTNTLNQSTLVQPSTKGLRDQQLQSNSINLNQSMIDQPWQPLQPFAISQVPAQGAVSTSLYDKAREQMWLAKYQKMQNKIQQYKGKIQKYQSEIIRQREEQEYTIENFTQLCQELKFRGIDEVEELQSQIQLLQDNMSKLSVEKGTLQYENQKQYEEIKDLKEDNQELEDKIKILNATIREQDQKINLHLGGVGLKQYNQKSRNEQENRSRSESKNQSEDMLESNSQNQGLAFTVSHQGLSGINTVLEQQLSTSQIRLNSSLQYGGLSKDQQDKKFRDLQETLDLKCENENLKWKLSILQVDTSNMVLQINSQMKKLEEADDAKKRIKALEKELDQQVKLVKLIKEESLMKSQDDIRKDNDEKQQLHQLISKFQTEKEQNQEIQRDRQRDNDSKVQDLQQQNNLLEASLKQTQLNLKKQINQNSSSTSVTQQIQQHQEELIELQAKLSMKDQQSIDLNSRIRQLEIDNEGYQKVMKNYQNHKQVDGKSEQIKSNDQEQINSGVNNQIDQVQYELMTYKVEQLEKQIQERDDQLIKLQVKLSSKDLALQESGLDTTDCVGADSGQIQNQQEFINQLRMQLDHQDQMKQKLNDHIVYLQTEIKKRDQLLDNSDFFDQEDFDSSIDDEDDDDNDSDHMLQSEILRDAQKEEGDQDDEDEVQNVGNGLRIQQQQQQNHQVRHSQVNNVNVEIESGADKITEKAGRNQLKTSFNNTHHEAQNVREIQEQIDRRLPETPSGSKISLQTRDKVEDQIRDQLDTIDQKLRETKSKQKKKKTVQTMLKEQLESLRFQLKKEIEQKMDLEKKLKNQSAQFSSVNEGLQDIQSVIKDLKKKEKQIVQDNKNVLKEPLQDDNSNDNLFEDDDKVKLDSDSNKQGSDDDLGNKYGISSDGDSMMIIDKDINSEKDNEELVQQMIQSIYEMQRFYQGQMSDLQHVLSMRNLKLEDMQSMKLDIEILNQEKQLSDNMYNSFKKQLDQSQQQVVELHRENQKAQTTQQEIQEKLRKEEERADRAEKQAKQEIEDVRKRCDDRVQDAERRIERRELDIKEFYENEVIKDIKDSSQRRVQGYQDDIKKLKESIDNANDKLERTKQDNEKLDRQLYEMQREKQGEIDQLTRDLKHEQSMIELKEMEKENQIQKLKLENQSKVDSINQEKLQLREQLTVQREQLILQIQQMRQENDSRSEELIEQRDNYKVQVKERDLEINKYEHENQKLLQQLDSLEGVDKEQIQELKAQLQEQEDLLNQNNNDLENYQEQVNQLDQENTDLKQQIELLKKQQQDKDATKDSQQKDSKQDQDHTAQISEMTQQLTDLNTNLKSKDETIQQLKAQNMKKEDEQFWKLVNQINDLKKDLQVKQESIERKDKQLSELASKDQNNSKYDNIDVDQIRKMYNEQIDELESQMEQTQKSNQSLQQEVEQLQVQISKLESEQKQQQPIQPQKLDNKYDFIASAFEDTNSQDAVVLQTNVNNNPFQQTEDSKPQQMEQQTIQEQANQEKNEDNSEVQSLLDYQFKINDKLNNTNEELHQQIYDINSKLEQSRDQNSQLRSSVDKLIKRNMELQNEIEQGQNVQKDQDSKQIVEESTVEVEQEKDEQVREIVYGDYGIKKLESDEQQEQILELQTSVGNLKIIAENEKEISKLHQIIESKDVEAAQLRDDLEKVNEQLLEQQFKAEYNQAQNDFEQDKNIDNELQTKETENQELRQQVKDSNEKVTELQKQIDELNENIDQHMKSAEELTNKFKDKLQKEKDKQEVLASQNQQLQEQIQRSSANQTDTASKYGVGDDRQQNGQELQRMTEERDKLKQQIDQILKEQLSLIDHLEQTKGFSFNLDKDESTDLGLSLLKFKKQIDLNLSEFDTQLEGLQQEKQSAQRQIIECLINAGIIDTEEEGNNDQWQSKPLDEVLQKLQVLLQNYLEDQRQIKQLLERNDEIEKENEEFKDLNYDLRYEIQELTAKLEQTEEEAQQQLVKYNKLVQDSQNTDTGKLKLKIEQLQEEKTQIRESYGETIENYQRDIDQLKKELESKPVSTNFSTDTSFTQPQTLADQPISKRTTMGNYGDLSVNKDLDEDLNETRIQPQKPKQKESESQPETQQDNQESSVQQVKVSKEQQQQPKTMDQQPKKDPQQPVKQDAPTLQKKAGQQQQQQPQPSGGLFSSIASFFLTESEMGVGNQEQSQTQRRVQKDQLNTTTGSQGGQYDGNVTEYEYYEYDDEEDEDDDGQGFMKETLDEEDD